MIKPDQSGVSSRRPRTIRVLITGGGTGGHLFPAIALAEELVSRREWFDTVQVLFIGTRKGLEARILPTLNYDYRLIWIRGFQRGFSITAILRNLLFPLRLMISVLQSAWIIGNFKPDLAIGTGGYTAGPPLFRARRRKIPFFIHEQNVFPGVTTRLLAGHAQRIYASFEATRQYIQEAIFYGTPLRRSLRRVPREQALAFFDLNLEMPTILIFGGSQGSRAMNAFCREYIQTIIDETNCQCIWQTGQHDYEELRFEFSHEPRLHLTPFIHDMGIAYSAADLAICRAGALTLAEICLYGLPSVLIPLPTAAGNHQEINARALEKQAASVVIPQSHLNRETSVKTIVTVMNDETLRSGMAAQAAQLARPDSARLIIDDIIDYMDHHVWNE